MPSEPMPCQTMFVDSSEYAALLMNSNQEIDLGCNIKWLGRSGVTTVKGIKIAFLSGIDSDILGPEVQSCDRSKYLGNYFTD